MGRPSTSQRASEWYMLSGKSRRGLSPRAREGKMPIRNREGQWHYRIWVRGREYSGNTGLEATERERKRAERIAEVKRLEIMTGKPEALQGDSVPFSVAAREFLTWCETTEYRARRSTAQR